MYNAAIIGMIFFFEGYLADSVVTLRSSAASTACGVPFCGKDFSSRASDFSSRETDFASCSDKLEVSPILKIDVGFSSCQENPRGCKLDCRYFKKKKTSALQDPCYMYTEMVYWRIQPTTVTEIKESVTNSVLVLVMVEHRERFVPCYIPCARTVIMTLREHAETWNRIDLSKLGSLFTDTFPSNRPRPYTIARRWSKASKYGDSVNQGLDPVH